MQYYNIKVAKLVKKDLTNIRNYISYELNNPIAALNLLGGISKEIKSLEKFPKRNKAEDVMLEKFNVRKINYKEYKIYYLVDDDNFIVYIIRIVHRLSNNRIWMYHTYDFEKK